MSRQLPSDVELAQREIERVSGELVRRTCCVTALSADNDHCSFTWPVGGQVGAMVKGQRAYMYGRWLG
jgi:hypothetical protein